MDSFFPVFQPHPALISPSNMESLRSILPKNPPFEFNTQNIVVAMLGYLLLCWLLRYLRQWYLWAKYPYKDRSSFANMTTTHAFEIQKRIFQYEFPFTAAQSLGFALFRTYGIPTISKLLVQTRQLSDQRYAPKVCKCCLFMRSVSGTNEIAEICGYDSAYWRIHGA
jgi:hypothetical protein